MPGLVVGVCACRQDARIVDDHSRADRADVPARCRPSAQFASLLGARTYAGGVIEDQAEPFQVEARSRVVEQLGAGLGKGDRVRARVGAELELELEVGGLVVGLVPLDVDELTGRDGHGLLVAGRE